LSFIVSLRLFARPSMMNPPAGEPVEFAKAICVRAHPSSDDAQLDLKVNDIVYVLERDDSGWWGGHKEGEDNTGWFPGSCVRAVPEQNELEVPAQIPTQIADPGNFVAEPTARPEFSVATFEADTARDVSPEQSFIESPRRRVKRGPAHQLATTPTPLVENCGDLPKAELQAKIQAKDKEISDLRTEVAEAKRKERQSDADLREQRHRLKEVEHCTDVERKKATELNDRNDELARKARELQDVVMKMKQRMEEKDSDLRSALQDLQQAQSLAQTVQRRPSESLQDPPVAQVADDAARRQLFSRPARESSTSQRLCWPAGEGKISSTNPDEQSSNADAQSSHRETPGGCPKVTGTPVSEHKELPVRGSVAEKVNVFEQRCTTQSPNRNFMPEAVRRGPNGSPVATPSGSWRSASRTRTQESLRATPTCTTKISPHSRPLPCIDLVLPPPEPEDFADEGAVVLGMSPIRSARPQSKMPTPAPQAHHRDGSPPRLPVAAQRSPNPRESAVSETSVRDRVRMFGR